MKAIKKPVEPPKFSPQQIAAAKKRMEAERDKKARTYSTLAKGNIKPSYPELYAIGAFQSLKNAISVYKGLKGIQKTVNYKKAGAAFGADVAIDSAVDYVDDKRKKK